MFFFSSFLSWGLHFLAIFSCADLCSHENSHFFELSNGVVGFFKENVREIQNASIRVIVKRDPFEPKIFQFELNSDNGDRLESFFEECRASLEPREQSLAVVSVGDLSFEHLTELIKAQFSDWQFVPLLKTHPALEESAEILLCENVPDRSYNRFAASYYADCFLDQFEPCRAASGLPDSHVPIVSVKDDVEDKEEAATNPFDDISLEDWEKKIIYKIITTMSEKNLFQLALEKRSLEKKGKMINHVHPLWFMGYILSEPRLKNDLYVIKRSHFKWDNFIDGFARRMKEESKKDNIVEYIPGFAELLIADPEMIFEYIEDHDWEGLVVALL